MSDDNKLITERKKKLEELSSVAKLYPNTFRRNTNANELRQKYDGKSKEELESEDSIFSVSGRLLTVRKMGNSTFANLHDDSGKIQLFLSKNGTGKDMYSLLNQTDLGDIVGAKGKIFKTKTGELSINVSEYIILSKSLRPLPEKYHGLSDVEIKYRQRYVDLMISENSRKVFKDRINIVSQTRKFFEQSNSSGLSFATNDVDAMVGYFESRGFARQSAISTATVLLTQAKVDGVNVFTLIDTLKGFDDMKLSSIVTEILNANRSKISSLGYKDSTVSNQTEKRNIVK